jgi:hypothetical protein
VTVEVLPPALNVTVPDRDVVEVFAVTLNSA